MPEDPSPPELEGLRSTDWQGMQHAYGPAGDLPGLLRLLLSGDEPTRDAAWEQLYSTVCHQGTVYEATAHVVPFLLRMLAYAGPPGQVPLLHFLVAVAEGSSYLAVHALPEDQQPVDWRQMLAEQGRDFDQELAKEHAWVMAARQAVGEGLPIYLELLSQPDGEVQRRSLAVLALLPERAAEIMPQLQALLASTSETALRGGIMRTLHALMDASPETQEFFASALAREEDKQVAFLAAAALAERGGAAAPDEAYTRLLEALQEMGRLGRDELGLEEGSAAWQWDDLDLALSAIASLGPGRSEPVLIEALPSFRSPEDALELAGVLLDLAFNEGQIQSKATAIGWAGQGTDARQTIDYWQPDPQPPRAAVSLTSPQRVVLVALAGHGPLWAHEHNLLALYGLPGTRHELRRFLT